MKAVRCQAIWTSFRSRSDGSLGASLVTPELTVPEKVAFMELQGIVTEVLAYPLDSKDAEVVEVAKEIDSKTPCARQRAVLFLIWKRKQPQETFEAFYEKRMEKNIEKLKLELDGI